MQRDLKPQRITKDRLSGASKTKIEVFEMSYPPPPMGTPPPPGMGGQPPPSGVAHQVPEKTVKPVIAGLMIIAASTLSLLGILFWILYSFTNIFSQSTSIDNYTASIGATFLFYGICWAVKGILSVVGIIGGIMALRRTNWALALAGAICVCLNIIGICCITPVILGIIALVFIIVSRKEFD